MNGFIKNLDLLDLDQDTQEANENVLIEPINEN